VYLLNLVHLSPGQAIHLPAGVLHAYLEGAGMEIMANSNNVLRGGLTPKHVDVAELIRNVVFAGGRAEILSALPVPGKGEWVYRAPAREFQLGRIEVEPSGTYQDRPARGAQILILTSHVPGAAVSASSTGQSLPLAAGDVFLVPCGVDYAVTASGGATLYKASVPQ
jgi:mannose-6-phosphate isomerase class I